MLNSSDTRPVSAERYLKVPSSDDNSIIKKEANENLIRSHDSIGFSCGSGSGDDLSAELYKRAGSAEFIRQKSSAGRLNKLLLVLLLLMIYSLYEYNYTPSYTHIQSHSFIHTIGHGTPLQ